LVFVLAMLLYPEAQEKAQKEIDSVIGSDQLPSMDDAPKLEYVDRLIQEVLRWRPIAPIGVFLIGGTSHLLNQQSLSTKGFRTLAMRMMCTKDTEFPKGQLCKFSVMKVCKRF
jgi:hypothetical protein